MVQFSSIFRDERTAQVRGYGAAWAIEGNMGKVRPKAMFAVLCTSSPGKPTSWCWERLSRSSYDTNQKSKQLMVFLRSWWTCCKSIWRNLNARANLTAWCKFRIQLFPIIFHLWWVMTVPSMADSKDDCLLDKISGSRAEDECKTDTKRLRAVSSARASAINNTSLVWGPGGVDLPNIDKRGETTL